MERDDLMADNIVARLKCWRDGDGPAIVIRNQYVSGPSARVAAAEESFLINLEPFQSGFVDRLAGSVAVAHVIEDWAMVACGPGRPLELELCASLYGSFPTP